MPFFGEATALATVLCWTCSVQFFEAAARRIGSVPVNVIRLFVALMLFSILQLFRDGLPFPSHFPAHAWFFLSLSGVVGFFIGDIFLFRALVELGPRVAMLIQSLAAPAAAIIGWLCLDEVYLSHQWAGMAIALSGVAIVIFERAKKTDPPGGQVSRKITPRGVGIGLVGMVGQAGGMVLSKVGMKVETGYLDAFSSTQVRAIAAFLCFVLFFTVTRRWRDVRTALADTKAVALTAMGAGFGPFAGVSLSLLTLHYLTTGVASTFFALVPITIIPFSIFLHRERVSVRAVAGAAIAVIGVSLLAI